MKKILPALLASVFSAFGLSGCNSGTYTQGYETGYKAGENKGREEGEKTGYREGYWRGQRAFVRESWLPTLACGLCIGAAWLTAWGMVKVTRRPASRFACEAMRWLSVQKTRLLAKKMMERLDGKVARLKKEESARVEVRLQREAADGLRRACRAASEAGIETAVADWLRHTTILKEMEARMDVAVRATEQALACIERAPSLSPEARLQLLKEFEAGLDGSRAECPPFPAFNLTPRLQRHPVLLPNSTTYAQHNEHKRH